MKKVTKGAAGLCEEILAEIRSQANPEAVAGMARFGINSDSTYGVSIPTLRKIAARTGRNHELAAVLWHSGIHEARLLAPMVEVSDLVTAEQMDRWVADFNSWDVCDQCCNNLFRKARVAHAKALEWSSRQEEFVKRAGFVMIACLAVHDKTAADEVFLKYLPAIARESVDSRNFVKKAVNWALRQIGKRNLALNRAALEAAEKIKGIDSKSARWVASDAIRELTGAKFKG
ncbi:MAG: DNA alkylation repair protein [Desulfomonile tiedjei]|nr:DNA alkylation repair protein [Desulfomonile tiedjei]